MNKHDKEKTAFACHRDLFEINVRPFGLSNSPAVFQELMVPGRFARESFRP